MGKFAAHLSSTKPPKPARDDYRRKLARLILEHEAAARRATKRKAGHLPALPPRRRIVAPKRRIYVRRAPQEPETFSEQAAALLERKRTNGGYRPPVSAATQNEGSLSEQAGRTLAAKMGGVA